MEMFVSIATRPFIRSLQPRIRKLDRPTGPNAFGLSCRTQLRRKGRQDPNQADPRTDCAVGLIQPLRCRSLLSTGLPMCHIDRVVHCPSGCAAPGFTYRVGPALASLGYRTAM
jgi:hypothetical protein